MTDLEQVRASLAPWIRHACYCGVPRECCRCAIAAIVPALDRLAARLAELENRADIAEKNLTICHRRLAELIPDPVQVAAEVTRQIRAAAVLRAAKAVSDFYANEWSGPSTEMDAKSEDLLVALTEAVEAWEGNCDAAS